MDKIDRLAARLAECERLISEQETQIQTALARIELLRATRRSGDSSGAVPSILPSDVTRDFAACYVLPALIADDRVHKSEVGNLAYQYADALLLARAGDDDGVRNLAGKMIPAVGTYPDGPDPLDDIRDRLSAVELDVRSRDDCDREQRETGE